VSENQNSTAGQATAATWLRTIGSWLLTAVMVVALMLALAVVVVPRAIGAVPLTVLTGSMRPVIQPGDLIVSRATNPNNLRIGQIVTFQPVSGDPTLITHRIVNTTRNLDGELISLVTRGDANGSDDAPLVPEQVMGRMLYRIPRIGHLTNNTGGALQIGMIVGAGLIAYAVYMLVKPDKKPDLPVVSPDATAGIDDAPMAPTDSTAGVVDDAYPQTAPVNEELEYVL